MCCDVKILFSEIEKLFRRDFQNFTELENDIERNANISKLDSADMTSVNVGQFGQLHLSQTLFLAVINDV